MSDNAFEVTTSSRDGRATVVCRGELDVTTMSLLDDAVATAVDARPSAIHLDCSGVTFIESGGFDELIELVDKCRATGVSLEISFNARARRLLRVLGLNEDLLPRETERLREGPAQPAR